jgi:hypothetical protein
MTLGLSDHHATYVSVYTPPNPHQILNASTNIYETFYVRVCYMSAHLNRVLHKSLPSFRLSVCLALVFARQRLGKNITTATNRHATIEFLNALCSIRSVSVVP